MPTAFQNHPIVCSGGAVADEHAEHASWRSLAAFVQKNMELSYVAFYIYIIYIIYLYYIHRYIPFDGKNFISHVEDPNHVTSTTIPPFEATNHGLGRVKVEQSESAGTLKQAPAAEAASLILEVPCI